MISIIIKRSFDLIFFFLIILILIIPILIYQLFKIDSSGPVFFLSKRVGRRKKIFLMPKFRTMINGTKEVETAQFKEINRITNFGKFLRKYSIDEIPQFFSVIVGDMSIVGPRPCLESQKNLINLRDQNNIYILKPGITGLAQISGRDNLELEEKVKYEIFYKNNQSFFLDLKILILTIFKILKQKYKTLKTLIYPET